MNDTKPQRSSLARLVLCMICLGIAGSVLATGAAAQAPAAPSPDDEWQCLEKCHDELFNELTTCPHEFPGNAIRNFFEKITCKIVAVEKNSWCENHCRLLAGH